MSKKILGVAAVVVMLAGCGEKKHAGETKAAERAPVAVKTVDAAEVEWQSAYEATGTVRARTAGQVSARVMGHVRQVNVNVGDRVNQGQVLVVIDDRDMAAGERQAEAGLREARDAMTEVDGAIAAAKAQLDLTVVTHKRMQDLFEKKSISRQEWDEAEMKLRVARAHHDMALSKRKQVAAKIQQAQEAVSAAQINKGFTQIAAPFAGVVTEKRVEPGNLAAPGQPLLIIEQAGAFRLEVPVEESRSGTIRAGSPVEVTLDATDKSFAASVSEVVPAVDPGSRAFTVKINLPAMANVRSGMFGRARFPQGKRKVLAVPAGAVESQGQLTSVLVVQDGHARSRMLTLGEASNGKVEVLSGLSAGEKVIHPRTAAVADGARVEASR